MRQRVMIAAALAQEPEILRDEPTTALDVTIQAQVLDLFRTMQQEKGLGLLYVTDGTPSRCRRTAVSEHQCDEEADRSSSTGTGRGSSTSRRVVTRRPPSATPRIDDGAAMEATT